MLKQRRGMTPEHNDAAIMGDALPGPPDMLRTRGMHADLRAVDGQHLSAGV
jgi:hypothetical protein